MSYHGEYEITLCNMLGKELKSLGAWDQTSFSMDVSEFTTGMYLLKLRSGKLTEIKKIVIYSRDEQKQFGMAQKFPQKQFPQIRFLYRQ